MNKRSLGTGKIWRRRQKGGSVWVGDWKTADGKRRRQVLSSDKRVAERKLAEIIRHRDLCAAGLETEESLDREVAAVVEEFLDDLGARGSQGYVERVTTIISRFLEHTRIRTMRQIVPPLFIGYRSRRLREGVANRTANMDLTVIRTMLNWAVSMGYLANNPLQAVRQLPATKAHERRPRRAMSEEEIDRFLAASLEIDQEAEERTLAKRTIEAGTKGQPYAGKQRRQVVPQTPMWRFLIETGARFGETVKSRWADFSEEESSIVLRAKTTKSRKERRLPLQRGLVEALASLRFHHHEAMCRMPRAGDPIFLTPKGSPWVENRRNALRRLEAVLGRAGIEKIDEQGLKIDIHALRHTAASRLARSGVSLVQAQKLLGHSDPKLTAAIYTHLDTEDLRAAIESLPPLSQAEG